MNCQKVPEMSWHADRRGRFFCGACWYSERRRPAIPVTIRRAVIDRDGMTCRLCLREVVLSVMHRGDRLHLDHIIQYADGGEHSVENLRVTCADCNLRRSRRDPVTKGALA